MYNEIKPNATTCKMPKMHYIQLTDLQSHSFFFFFHQAQTKVTPPMLGFFIAPNETISNKRGEGGKLTVGSLGTVPRVVGRAWVDTRPSLLDTRPNLEAEPLSC